MSKKTFDTTYFTRIQKELIAAAKTQDRYELSTINLIAPASPTPLKYLERIPLKYNAIAEGLLEHRPYAGVAGFNAIERIAAEVACQLFGADHANVQPHSVSQANQAAYQALLQPGDQVLAMKFHDGGHLTHGLHLNFSGKFYHFDFYGVDKDGVIDYDALEEQAVRLQPKMIVCGASSYPRDIHFKRLHAICKKVGAFLLADVSHPAGLIVAKKFSQPFPYCDVVTFTLDKTMMGPHGGIILCKKELSQKIDKAVHPGTQSSVPLRRIYQMAQCLIDAGKPAFGRYINRVIANIKVFENEFSHYPGLMVTGGSDTHLMVLNTFAVFHLTGKEAEGILESVDILTNRQVVPNETQSPYVASGIRLGTSWITARGYSQAEAKRVAQMIIQVLSAPKDLKLQEQVRKEVRKMVKKPRRNDVWGKDLL